MYIVGCLYYTAKITRIDGIQNIGNVFFLNQLSVKAYFDELTVLFIEYLYL